MKKRIAVFIVTVLLVGVFTSCANRITEGEVTEKEFLPAETTVMVLPVVTSNGKTASTSYIPYTVCYPDRWYITIQKYSEKEEKMLTATYRVTEDVYDAVEVGDEFVYDKNYEPTEPEYTRIQE